MSTIDALQPYDVHNQELERQVRPRDWQNPAPRGRYNLVVIGAGTAGLVTAVGAAGLGARVALVERSLLGGDCLNVGCVPSKALIRSARAMTSLRRAKEFGLREPGLAEFDFAAAMERMRRLRAGISHHDSVARMKSLGIDVYLGQARFSGSNSVQVDGQSLEFKRAVIATGARAASITVPGIEKVDALTNETLFSLTRLPRRLAVIGGGPIGSEMAQAFARFGSDVTLIERSPRILSRDDPQAAEIVASAMVRDGVDLRTNSNLLAVSIHDGLKRITIETGERQDQIEVDEILLAAGRRPNIEGLGLDVVGVESDPRQGIRVNDRLRTTHPNIYAAGDVCSPCHFTHAADFMARIVIQNALFMGRKKSTALQIPWATYTSPELAQIGLTESMAAEQGIEIDTYRQDFASIDRAILDGETEGFVKVHTRKGSDKIAGATIVNSHAGELISALSIAMTHNLGLRKIANSIHPYPTHAEAIRKIGDLYNKTRLTPLVAGLFRKWLKWTG